MNKPERKQKESRCAKQKQRQKHATKRKHVQIQKHRHCQRQKHKQHCLPKPPPDVRPVKHNKGQHINHWNEPNMEMAVQEFRRGVIGVRQLARAWNDPKSTLQRRVRGIVSGTDHASGRKCVFSRAEEEELSSLLTTLVRRGFPLAIRFESWYTTMRRSKVKTVSVLRKVLLDITGSNNLCSDITCHWKRPSHCLLAVHLAWTDLWFRHGSMILRNYLMNFRLEMLLHTYGIATKQVYKSTLCNAVLSQRPVHLVTRLPAMKRGKLQLYWCVSTPMVIIAHRQLFSKQNGLNPNGWLVHHQGRK